MGVWAQIRAVLSAVWTEWQGPHVEAQQPLLVWLADAWRTEQRLIARLRQVAPAVPYEHLRKRLEAMADDDEQHATLLQRHLEAIEGFPNPYRQASAASPNSAITNPWRYLLGILRDKRELYERYRQEAVFVDDADLQSLLQRLHAEEAQHQEQLVDILTHLDAHVHETMT